MEAGLKLKSNEARDTSTIHCLVTADVPLNPSATKQWYYITNSANKAGQWLQVQYCFHLTFQRLNDKAIYCTVRIVSLRQMTLLQSIIFIYPITPKTVSPPFTERKKAGEQAWNSLVYAYLNLDQSLRAKSKIISAASSEEGPGFVSRLGPFSLSLLGFSPGILLPPTGQKYAC